MKVLIIGVNGLLGQKLMAELNETYQVVAASVEPEQVIPYEKVPYHQVDITDYKSLSALIVSTKPDVIANTAAYTDVDGSEDNREICWKVNADGVDNIARAARRRKSKVIHISTDYIFDGTAGPYAEDARPNPLSYYGKAKLAGENLLIGSGAPYVIIRTNVLYGNAFPAQSSFVGWVRAELTAGHSIRVVTDQYNNPTLANDLASCILRVAQLDAEGIYNYAGGDYINRLEFAQMIADEFGLPAELIIPVKTADLKQKAPRPEKGGLITDKARDNLGLKIFGVEHGLEVMMAEEIV